MLTAAQTRALIARILAFRAAGVDATPSLSADQDLLFASCRRPVAAVCQRVLEVPRLADEIAQEAFATAWEKLEAFEHRSSFTSWVTGIALRKALAYLRLKHTTHEILVEDGLLEAESADRSILDQLEEDELCRFVRKCVAHLEPLEQEVAWMRYVDGLPYKDIERILEIDLTERRAGVRGILKTMKARLEVRLRQGLEELRETSSFLRDRSAE